MKGCHHRGRDLLALAHSHRLTSQTQAVLPSVILSNKYLDSMNYGRKLLSELYLAYLQWCEYFGCWRLFTADTTHPAVFALFCTFYLWCVCCRVARNAARCLNGIFHHQSVTCNTIWPISCPARPLFAKKGNLFWVFWWFIHLTLLKRFRETQNLWTFENIFI